MGDDDSQGQQADAGQDTGMVAMSAENFQMLQAALQAGGAAAAPAPNPCRPIVRFWGDPNDVIHIEFSCEGECPTGDCKPYFTTSPAPDGGTAVQLDCMCG